MPWSISTQTATSSPHFSWACWPSPRLDVGYTSFGLSQWP
ncbi:hypothetical protein CGRA01v4_10185 [Colletotrichum graminicola]|nr:hypothetical protein CGRA01v4_10185 [Colletotrichum graminicola]